MLFILCSSLQNCHARIVYSNKEFFVHNYLVYVLYKMPWPPMDLTFSHSLTCTWVVRFQTMTDKITIYSMNAGGLRQAEICFDILNMAEKTGIPILCLQEMHLTNKDYTTLKVNGMLKYL